MAILAWPLLPHTAEAIITQLALPVSFPQHGPDDAPKIPTDGSHKLGKPQILFKKIEDTVIDKEIKRLKANLKMSETAPAEAITSEITFDDFIKVDLRTAKIIQAEPVPKSDKLLKIKVDLGFEERQVLAGIAKHYKPEDLIGKTVVIAANLAPRKLMGQVSEGMILAANGKDGLTLLDADSSGLGERVQ